MLVKIKTEESGCLKNIKNARMSIHGSGDREGVFGCSLWQLDLYKFFMRAGVRCMNEAHNIRRIYDE